MIEQSTCIRFKKTSSQAEATDHIEFQVSNKEYLFEVIRILKICNPQLHLISRNFEKYILKYIKYN